jgi:hypothetical protein
VKYALALAAVIAAWLIPTAVVAVVRRFKQAQSTFDTLVESEAGEHATPTLTPHLEFIPDGFTCLYCEENPALPERVWCAVCAPTVDQYPAEPIERSAK